MRRSENTEKEGVRHMRRRTAGNPVSSLAASQFSVQLLTHIDPRYSRNDQTAKEG